MSWRKSTFFHLMTTNIKSFSMHASFIYICHTFVELWKSDSELVLTSGFFHFTLIWMKLFLLQFFRYNFFYFFFFLLIAYRSSHHLAVFWIIRFIQWCNNFGLPFSLLHFLFRFFFFILCQGHNGSVIMRT
jgi:hypothetical protein